MEHIELVAGGSARAKCARVIEDHRGSGLTVAGFVEVKGVTDGRGARALGGVAPEAVAGDVHSAGVRIELARGQWIDEKFNACFIGNAGTGKTHLAVALGQAACRQNKRVRFYTAATLVNTLEEAQKQYRLERVLTALERVDLLVVDELGYLSFSRSGAELLFQVFADRYVRGSILITSNLPFGAWGQVFQGERMTAALLDRFTHRCHIFEMKGESFRFGGIK